jgi:hypothetical protein
MRCDRCGKDNPADVHTCSPLALKLADYLHDHYDLYPRSEQMQAAKELRRLHEEIFKLAQELGREVPSGPDGIDFFFYLERFAALVAEREREECAQLCDNEFAQWIDQNDDGAVAVKQCADAIRARSQK